MTMLLLLAMGMLLGFIWLCHWLGRKAGQNPGDAAQIGLKIGRWLLK
jgi:hypothetical protein